MGALATGEAERLLRFVAEAESLNGKEPWPAELLHELGTLVQADWVGFSDLDWEQRRLAFAVERPGDELEVDAGMERLFWGEFADAHPIRQAALRGYVGALKISDFAGRRELRRTRFYNEWMRVNECEHALDLSLRSAPNSTLTFHFDRAIAWSSTFWSRISPGPSRMAGARWVAC